MLKFNVTTGQFDYIRSIPYLDARYVNVTGDTMTGGLSNLTSINPLTTLAESWIGPSSTTGIYFKGGNVGIGTTSPDAKLSIYGGNLSLNSGITADREWSIIPQPNTYTGSGNYDLEIKYTGASYGGNVLFTSGNVGIGTTKPGTKLDIGGNIDALASTSPIALISDNVNAISGVQMGNINVGTSADFRFIIKDTTGHYLTFAQPSVNNESFSLFGLNRKTTDFIFNNAGTTRDLAIGSLSDKSLILGTNSLERMRITNAGNVGIGITNPAVKLQVNSVLADESASLGSELLSADNWTTGTGWSGDFATGFAHTSGTADLSNTLAGVINNYYQITYTVTNRTAGSFTITFGGQSWSGINSTGSFGPKATTTDSLVITPTDTFNGTIVLSIKQITGTYLPTFALYDSTGASNFEIRNSKSSLDNIFIGKGAGRYNTTGYQNSSFGNYALYSNTTGRDNLAIGENVLRFNTTGYSNSAQGVACLYSNTTGYNNAGLGAFSLYSNTTGSNNSAQGLQALYFNTTGSDNSAIGINALYSNKTGSRGVAIGNDSQIYANNTTTPWINANTSVGYQSLRGSTTASNNTGNRNTAFGYQSLWSNTGGNYNTAQGMQALQSNTTGSYNTTLGHSSGRYLSDGSTGRKTGDYGLYLGYNAMASVNGTTNEIVIGYNAIGNGSNTAVIGNADITDIYMSSDIGATVHAGKFKLGALNTAPASASATGTLGEIRFTADTLYFCIATDTWVKATLASW